MLGGACTVLQSCLPVQTQRARYLTAVRCLLCSVHSMVSGWGLSVASCRGLQLNQDSHHNNVHRDAA